MKSINRVLLFIKNSSNALFCPRNLRFCSSLISERLVYFISLLPGCHWKKKIVELDSSAVIS